MVTFKFLIMGKYISNEGIVLIKAYIENSTSNKKLSFFRTSESILSKSVVYKICVNGVFIFTIRDNIIEKSNPSFHAKYVIEIQNEVEKYIDEIPNTIRDNKLNSILDE